MYASLFSKSLLDVTLCQIFAGSATQQAALLHSAQCYCMTSYFHPAFSFEFFHRTLGYPLKQRWKLGIAWKVGVQPKHISELHLTI